MVPDDDLDAAIRERLFQPLVDRLHLDPVPTAWNLHLAHTAAMAMAAPCVFVILKGPAGTTDPTGAVVAGACVLTLACSCLSLGRRLRRQPWLNMTAPGAFLRAIYASAALMAWFAVAGSYAGHAPIIQRLGSVFLAVAFAMGTLAGYVQVCRQPPPRRPRTSRRPALAG